MKEDLKATKVHAPKKDMEYSGGADDEKEGPHEHEVAHAMKTVMEAEEIKCNEKMWPAVQAKMQKHMDSMKKFTSTDDLRAEIKKKKA